jgi:hypothetical protein
VDLGSQYIPLHDDLAHYSTVAPEDFVKQWYAWQDIQHGNIATGSYMTWFCKTICPVRA